MIDTRKLQDAIDYICGEISRLKDELDHEENVEHDRFRVFFIKADLDNMKNVLDGFCNNIRNCILDFKVMQCD